MAKFKQVPQSFMFRKLVKYSRNMVKNFDGDCRDSDFFDVVRNCLNFAMSFLLCLSFNCWT